MENMMNYDTKIINSEYLYLCFDELSDNIRFAGTGSKSDV